jgi:Baseplate J-like protein
VTYVEPDLINDETTVAEGLLAGLADRIEGWQAAEGHIETALAEALGAIVATAITVLKASVQDAYVGHGTLILGIPRGVESPASAISTWTLTAGHAGVTIAGGTEVELTLSTGGTSTFVVAEDVVVAPGVTTQTGVELIAEEAGPDHNGATNPASQFQLADVESVSVDAPATGGVDPEEPEDYVQRVADRARRLHAIPITPDDYAAFATDVAAVGRAYAVNRYDPANPGVDSAGHLTVIVMGEDGLNLSSGDKDTVDDYLNSIDRPLNVTTHVADPDRVNVTAAATVRATADADTADVQARAQAAIQAAIDPATFAADADRAFAGGFADTIPTELTIFDVSAAIDDLEGVAKVLAVTINGGEDPVALPGPLSIPQLSATPTVTVAAP